MNSESIYILSKLKLEEQKLKDSGKANPLKIQYEYCNMFRFETAFFMPCHISSFGRYLYTSDLRLRREAVNAYDIVYVYAGKLVVSRDNKNITLSENDVLFIHTDRPYEMSAGSNANVDFMFLSNNGLISREYYNLITKKGLKLIHVKNPCAFDIILDKLLFYMKYPSSTNNALAIDTLMNLFTELYLSSINTEEYDNAYGYPKWFVRLVSYIDENYRSSLTIEDFTQISGLSASHLHKLFKEYTGTSPYNYLLDVRINQSKNLLLNKELSVKYISYYVGFKSVNHYISHFKKLTGTTPNLYRNP